MLAEDNQLKSWTVFNNRKLRSSSVNPISHYRKYFFMNIIFTIWRVTLTLYLQWWFLWLQFAICEVSTLISDLRKLMVKNKYKLEKRNKGSFHCTYPYISLYFMSSGNKSWNITLFSLQICLWNVKCNLRAAPIFLTEKSMDLYFFRPKSFRVISLIYYVVFIFFLLPTNTSYVCLYLLLQMAVWNIALDLDS